MQNAIDVFRKKLDEIQRNRAAKLNCRECGHEVVVTDNFCGLCGAKQIPVKGIASCSKHTGKPDDDFCTTCGARKRL